MKNIDSVLKIILKSVLFLLLIQTAAYKYVESSLPKWKDMMVENDAKFDTVDAEYEQILNEKNFYDKVIDIDAIMNNFGIKFGDCSVKDVAYSIVYESELNKVDPYLILAMMEVESSFKKMSISQKGAIGLMQVKSGTAEYISSKSSTLSLNDSDELYDSITNVKVGVHYFGYLKKKFNNDRHALIAYNIGPSYLYDLFSENKKVPSSYYNKIRSSYKKIKTMSGRV